MEKKAGIVKSPADSKTTTGIGAILASAQTYLSSFIKPIVLQSKKVDFPTDSIPQNLLNFLSTCVIVNPVLSQSFERIAVLAQVDPRSSFQEIRDYFFRIPMDKNEPLTEKPLGNLHWISRLGEKNLSSLNLRSVLFYVVENYVAEIVFKIVKLSENQDVDFFISEYFDSIVKSLANPIHAQLFLTMTNKFELIINQLSLKAPTATWKWVLEFLNEKNQNQQITTFVFKSLRSFTFVNIPAQEIDSQHALSTFQKILSSFAISQPLSESVIATSHFLTAVAADMLTLPKDSRPENLITALFNVATAQGNQKFPAVFPLICTFFSLSDNGRRSLSLSQILLSALRLSRQALNSEPLILYGLKRILSGRNYLPHCNENCEETLQWRADKRDIPELKDMFSIISTCGSLDKSSDELASFLTQLAVNKMDAFVESYIPDLESSNFMKANGIAVFEAGRRLIPTGSPELCKRFSELFTHFISEFGGVDKSSMIPGIPTELCKIDELFETSAPILPQTCVAKRMMQDVTKLQKAVSPDDKKPFTYDVKVELTLNNDLTMIDSPLARCISIVPLLGFSEELTSFVVTRIFDQSAFIASLASRCLMLLANKYPEKVTHIVSLLLTQTGPSLEQLYVMLNAIIMIIGVVKEEKYINDLTETIAPAIISGLCSVSYELRSKAFELIELTPISKFFEEKNSEITSLTLKKIASVFVSDYDAGALQQLSLQPFKEFAASKYEVIYHIYLSVVFTVLQRTESAFKFFQTSQWLVTKAFTYIVDEIDKNKTSPLYAINLATFLISVADSKSNINQSLYKVIGDVIMIVNQRIPNEPFAVILYSFAATVHKDNTLVMLKLLTGPNELYLRAFSFVAHLYVQNNNVVSDPDTLKSLLGLMDVVVNFCGSSSLVSTTEIVPVKELSTLMVECLTSFAHVVEIVCSQFRQHNTLSTTGPFLHRPNTQQQLEKHQWFFFMFNLTSLPDTFPERLRSAAKNAFAEFCSVNTIPDEWFQSLINHVLSIAPSNTLACSYILSHSFGFFLDHFIRNSAAEPHFFRCIALQFPEPHSIESDSQILAHTAPKILSSSEQEFADTLYAHIGDILALCFLFLSGERSGFEKDAQKVLYHIVLSGSLFVDSENISEAFEHLNDTSFTSLLRLSTVLSDNFAFCVEQFISQSLQILNDEFLVCFACLIQPWFRDINLRREHDAFISESQPVFQRFTAITFLQQFIRIVGKTPMQPPAISLLDTTCSRSKDVLEFVFTYCFFAYSELREEAKTVLVYLCRKNRELAHAALSFLRFKYWWYSVIQLRSFDRFFDFDRFLNEMKNDKKQENPTSKIDPNAFDEDVSFALEVCTELIPYYEELKPVIVAFCITRARSEPVLRALELCTGFEAPTVADIRQSLGPNLKEFFQEAFLWATSCGDTEHAVAAAKYVAETVVDPTPNMIEHILRSLRVYVLALRENSVPSEDKKHKKHLAKLLQGDSEVNLKLIYRHISYLLDIICGISKSIRLSDAQLLNAVCSFAACGDNELQPIFESFVNLAWQLVEIPNTIKNSQVEGGVVMKVAIYNLLILDKKKGKKVVHKFFQLTGKLFADGLFNLIFPRKFKFSDPLEEGQFLSSAEVEVSEEQQIAASLLWLIPFLAVNCPEHLFRSIEHVAAQTISIDISPIWSHLRCEHCSDSLSVASVVSTLVNTAGPPLIQAITKVFSHIMSYTTKYSNAIYTLSRIALESTVTPTELSMRRIAIPALKERDSSCSEAVSSFLLTYQRMVGNYSPLPGMMMNTQFPVVNICENLPKWEKGEFPMYPTECSFFYFNVIEELRNECLELTVEPFTQWSNTLFSAESVRVAEVSTIGASPEITTNCVSRFLSMINTTDSISSNESPHASSIKKLSSICDISAAVDQNETLLLVPSSTFIPTIADIDNIAIDITGKILE